jgi:hypothetical protein
VRSAAGLIANESVHAEPTWLISPTVRTTMETAKMAIVTQPDAAGAAAKPRLATERHTAAAAYPRSARSGVAASTLAGYCSRMAHPAATA